MQPQRCTLRNIADYCQVSTAMVSAVLNGRTERISCSETTRNKILDAARKLNYTPNALARSMREKKVPLVGVFLRQHPQTGGLLSDSNVRMLSAATEFLNQCGYETIFVPFTDSQSQLKRMKSLISSGLIGGIITCIIKEESKDICQLLKHAHLPYLILGKPLEKDVYCIYPVDRISNERCLEFAAKKNLEYCFSAEPSYLDKDKYIFRALPYANDFVWDAPEVPEEEVRRLKEESLFSVMGMDVAEKLTKAGFDERNFVINEFVENRSKVPEHFNAVFVRRAALTAQDIHSFFAPRLLENRPMTEFHRAVPAEEDCFEFRFNLT